MLEKISIMQYRNTMKQLIFQFNDLASEHTHLCNHFDEGQRSELLSLSTDPAKQAKNFQHVLFLLC